jgi:cytochrome b561
MPGADPAVGYAPAAKGLHWVSALLVIGMIGVGLWMVDLPLGYPKLYAYAWHKWIGLTVLVLTLARLVWRAYRPPPPLPASVTAWERLLAPGTHLALLIVLLAMPLSGWMMSSAAGVSVTWFGLIPLPDLVARDARLFEALRGTHRWLGWMLMLMLGLHLLAVVRHDVLRRDGIFRRMSPFTR